MSKNLFNSVLVSKPNRNRFDLTHDVKMSLKMGLLYPVCCFDTVPGDKFDISCETLLRFAPLVAPVMHRMDVYIHYYFVPNRLLWAGWQGFITQGEMVGDLDAAPYVSWQPGTFDFEKVGSLGDYLGLPVSDTPGSSGVNVNAFPFAAYQMIYDEYYRDQNLIESDFGFVAPREYLVSGDNTAFTDLFTLRRRAWEHDYFTSCLPFAQKGDGVLIPSLGFAEGKDLKVLRNSAAGAATQMTNTGTGTNPLSVGNVTTADTNIGADQLYALGQNLELNSQGTVNDLRTSFRIQEYLELAARGGTRLIEWVRAQFGVNSSDARLQRPEYITGVKSPVVISEVLNSTGESGGLPQGNMAGHGVSVTSGKYGHYFCEEHGWIMGIMSVMPKTAYSQGFNKKFLRYRDPLDYYVPKLANLGEQAVKNFEVYYDAGVAGEETFGYLPRFAEYKFENNRIAGDFRTSLDYWHLAREFGSTPGLNQDFIECVPDTRIFAVEDGTDYLFVHHLNKVMASRLMPKYGTPRF